MNLAPIVVFTYTRFKELQLTLNALKRNYLAHASELIIFSDAPKNSNEASKVEEIRNYLKTISGFKKIKIYENEENLGLAQSVIQGVSQVVNQYSKAIVLEDDLVTSPNFLSFMNDALNFYESKHEIFSISGYTFPFKNFEDSFDNYFSYRASSWGWAVWSRSWKEVEWKDTAYKDLLTDKKFLKRLTRGGIDLPKMLKKQLNNKIDSWAVKWCFHQAKNNQLTVFPKTSKVYHIGYGNGATHLSNISNSLFETHLDTSQKSNFKLSDNINVKPNIGKKFKYQFSYRNKALTYFRAYCKQKI